MSGSWSLPVHLEQGVRYANWIITSGTYPPDDDDVLLDVARRVEAVDSIGNDPVQKIGIFSTDASGGWKKFIFDHKRVPAGQIGA